MRTVCFIPPLSRLSGGLRTIYDTVRSLVDLGYTVAVTSPGKAQGLDELVRELAGRLAVLPWTQLPLTPSDLWLVPESWPNAIVPGINAGAHTLVYAQSWSLVLTGLPQGVRWNSLPVSFLAVSAPVAWYLETLLQVPVKGILPPQVDDAFFQARQQTEEERNAGTKPGKPVRVAWMPRKNKVLAEQIQLLTIACLAREASSPPVEWVPVQGLSLRETARALAGCHLFLCTAFPEGFGLPPLESMAAGCVPVGFTGFGGWEYMRQAALPQSCLLKECPQTPLPPPFSPLPEKPWGGNGLYLADGDIMSAALALASLVRLAHTGGEPWLALRQNGQLTAAHYTRAIRRNNLATLWAELQTQTV